MLGKGTLGRKQTNVVLDMYINVGFDSQPIEREEQANRDILEQHREQNLTQGAQELCYTRN